MAKLRRMRRLGRGFARRTPRVSSRRRERAAERATELAEAEAAASRAGILERTRFPGPPPPPPPPPARTPALLGPRTMSLIGSAVAVEDGAMRRIAAAFEPEAVLWSGRGAGTPYPDETARRRAREADEFWERSLPAEIVKRFGASALRPHERPRGDPAGFSDPAGSPAAGTHPPAAGSPAAGTRPQAPPGTFEIRAGGIRAGGRLREAAAPLLLAVLERLCEMLAIRLSDATWAHLRQLRPGEPVTFVSADVARIESRVKTLPLVEVSHGRALSRTAAVMRPRLPTVVTLRLLELSTSRFRRALAAAPGDASILHALTENGRAISQLKLLRAREEESRAEGGRDGAAGRSDLGGRGRLRRSKNKKKLKKSSSGFF
jgi:hypothetical protein